MRFSRGQNTTDSTLTSAASDFCNITVETGYTPARADREILRARLLAKSSQFSA